MEAGKDHLDSLGAHPRICRELGRSPLELY